jgi:hypothetical protein
VIAALDQHAVSRGASDTGNDRDRRRDDERARAGNHEQRESADESRAPPATEDQRLPREPDPDTGDIEPSLRESARPGERDDEILDATGNSPTK